MVKNRWKLLIMLTLALALLSVSATAATTGITLEVKKVTIIIGDTYSVPYTLAGENPDPVTLKSSKPAVVQVVDERDVLALKAGKSKITVKSGAKKAILTVTVVPPPPESVTLDAGEISLKKGETRKLVATVLPTAANQKVGWKSSNKKIATVTAKGVVKGVGAGECVITCTTKTGQLTASANVTVTAAPAPTPSKGKVSIDKRTDLCVVENYSFGKPSSVDYLLKMETNGASGPIALKIFDPSSNQYLEFTTAPVVKNAVYDLTIHYAIAYTTTTRMQNELTVVYNAGANKYEGAAVKSYALRPESAAIKLVSGGSGEDVDFSADGKTLVKYNATDKDAYTVPDGVEHIADEAFKGHGELKRITLPEGLKSTGEYCFRECRALTTINLPQSLTQADHCMFAFCDKLDNVVIPAGLKTLPEWMFCDCFSLKSVVVPEGVTTIENYAFYGCAALRELTLPASITSIKGEDVFYGCSPSLVVYGRAGSVVEQYCDAHGVTFQSR